MFINEKKLLENAFKGKYAVGAFNVYNMEGVKAVISAAENKNSPVILQLHPIVIEYGGIPFIEMCKKSAENAKIPVAVHLDHSDSEIHIKMALEAGIKSVMADGSKLSYKENIEFTKKMSILAHDNGAVIEGELGRLTGTEDGESVESKDSMLTDPIKAKEYVECTNVDTLAVCIGNVHGRYKEEPKIDFERLTRISKGINIPLVLHGASGLKENIVKKSIQLGVCKFNVNTEVRDAYLNTLRKMSNSNEKLDLLDIMNKCIEDMEKIVSVKIELFGSNNKC